MTEPKKTIKTVDLERVRQIVNAFTDPQTARSIMISLDHGTAWIHEVPVNDGTHDVL